MGFDWGWRVVKVDQFGSDILGVLEEQVVEYSLLA